MELSMLRTFMKSAVASSKCMPECPRVLLDYIKEEAKMTHSKEIIKSWVEIANHYQILRNTINEKVNIITLNNGL